MASETVDKIDWSHPHPHWQYPLSYTYCTVAPTGIQDLMNPARLVAPTGIRTREHGYARSTHYLCGHATHEEGKNKKVKIDRSKVDTKVKNYKGLAITWTYRSPGSGRYSPKQWMN